MKRKSTDRNKITVKDACNIIRKHCMIGGPYSTLELVIIAAQKTGFTIQGDKHPGVQAVAIARQILQEQKKGKEQKFKTKKDFYSSRAWKILRYQALEKYGARCQCCGATAADGVQLHVDHIKPRSKFPHLALDLDNLQVLCSDCNTGKINQFDTNWREHWESL